MKQKPIFYITVMAALAACNTIESPCDITGPIPFEAGQEVIISTGSISNPSGGAGSDTRLLHNYSSSGIDFVWEAGDKIKVTVGDKSSVFTINSGVGTTSATFTGKMPASGSTFSVQYPVENISEDVFINQTYVEGRLPDGVFSAAATGCNLGSDVLLIPQLAAVRLNCYGTHSEIVDSVVATNEATGTRYKLNLTSSMSVGSTTASAKTFFMAVPAGSYECHVDVYTQPGEIPALTEYIEDGISYGLGKPVQKSNRYSVTPAAGYVNNKTEEITNQFYVWAPVNVGYEVDKYGAHFQHGRLGRIYYDHSYYVSYDDFNDLEDDDDVLWGHYTDMPSYSEEYRWYWIGDDIGWGKPYFNVQPCPEGWHIPDIEGSHLWQHSSVNTTYDGMVGRWFSGGIGYSETAYSVFLPFSGWIVSYGSIGRDTEWEYWCLQSTVDANEAETIGSYMEIGSALPIRCVQDGAHKSTGSLNHYTVTEQQAW